MLADDAGKPSSQGISKMTHRQETAIKDAIARWYGPGYGSRERDSEIGILIDRIPRSHSHMFRDKYEHELK